MFKRGGESTEPGLHSDRHTEHEQVEDTVNKDSINDGVHEITKGQVEHLQEMSGALLQADQEVEQDTEDGERREGDRDIHESERSTLSERMIHGGLKLTKDNWSLGEHGRDFRHRCKSGEKDGAIHRNVSKSVNE